LLLPFYIIFILLTNSFDFFETVFSILLHFKFAQGCILYDALSSWIIDGYMMCPWVDAAAVIKFSCFIYSLLLCPCQIFWTVLPYQLFNARVDLWSYKWNFRQNWTMHLNIGDFENIPPGQTSVSYFSTRCLINRLRLRPTGRGKRVK